MGKWVEARLVVSRITNQSAYRKHIDSNKYILIHTHQKKNTITRIKVSKIFLKTQQNLISEKSSSKTHVELATIAMI